LGIAVAEPQEQSCEFSEPVGEEYALAPLAPDLPNRVGPLHFDAPYSHCVEVPPHIAPKPPRWTFFSGVFDFPWRSEWSQRWAYLFMTAGLSTLIFIGLIAERLIAEFSDVAASMALCYLIIPCGIIVGLFAFSYCASCCLCVLVATAAGEDSVRGWPELDWKEWLGHLVYMSWVGTVPLAGAYGLGMLAAVWGLPLVWTVPALFFSFYPVALMSSLLADSIWVPISRAVLATLARCWWCWLVFFALSGILVFGLTAATIGCWRSSPHSFLMCLGPLVPGVLLIYARLFGRLAWRITLRL
jgi:hypothetical protein